jgi:hypothetical protein
VFRDDFSWTGTRELVHNHNMDNPATEKGRIGQEAWVGKKGSLKD